MALHITTNLTNVTNSMSLDYEISSTTSGNTDAEVTSNEYSLLLTRFVVQKICVPIVVLVGVIGNSLSIIVLTRKCMKSSTNSYLTALAVFDLLYLVFSFTLSLEHYTLFKTSFIYVHWYPFDRVLTDMFANVSVILTVTFTVERYIGVCHPMKGRILCTSQRAKLITAIVSTIAILCTAPEFWEMEVLYTNVDNQTVPKAVYTEFSSRPSYEIGYYWFLVVMFTLLPLLLLCVFNGILISTVIKAAKLRKEMTLLPPISGLSNNSSNGHKQPKEQQKITKMLITVVLAFIACQLPVALLLLVRTYNSLAGTQLSKEKENNLKIAGNITNLLIQTNASINFILYSAISTKFRRVFYRIICHGKRCLCFLLSRSHNNFSRSDGVQMSSFYGDKPGSKATSMSVYTFKVKVSQRSPRSPTQMDKDPLDTAQKHWGRHIAQSGLQADKENRGNQHLCLPSSHNPSGDVTINGRDSVRGRCNIGDVATFPGAYCKTKNSSQPCTYDNQKDRFRLGWRGNRDSNCRCVHDNLNR